MSDGPSDEDVRRAERAAQEAKETAAAFAPYVEANRLNPLLLKRVLDKHSPFNDAEDDGIYDQRWIAADAFYRFTEEYVALDKRLAYKHELDRAFPKRGTL
jgi:hypothetical protein